MYALGVHFILSLLNYEGGLEMIINSCLCEYSPVIVVSFHLTHSPLKTHVDRLHLYLESLH